MHDFPVDNEVKLLYSCPATVWLGGSVNLHILRFRRCSTSHAVVLLPGNNLDEVES
jgi:hypothetical protein